MPFTTHRREHGQPGDDRAHADGHPTRAVGTGRVGQPAGPARPPIIIAPSRKPPARPEDPGSAISAPSARRTPTQLCETNPNTPMDSPPGTCLLYTSDA